MAERTGGGRPPAPRRSPGRTAGPAPERRVGGGGRPRFGRTWWSDRWLTALAELGLLPARVGHAPGFRLPRVHTVEIRSGAADVAIGGPRGEWRFVTVRMDPVPAASWDRLMEVLSRRALYAARLLGGEMPEGVEPAFTEAGVDLFPREAADLLLTCDGPGEEGTCTHAMAALRLLAARFDEDPFQLLLFRGIGRVELLDGIRRLWTGDPPADPPVDQPRPRRGRPQPETGSEAEVLARFWEPDPSIEQVRPRIESPLVDGAVLLRLGPPPGTVEDSAAEGALRRAYQLINAWALRRGLQEEAAEN
jgi:uncharacterized Zn finger protein